MEEKIGEEVVETEEISKQTEQVEYSPEEYRDQFIRMREFYDKKLLNKGSIEQEKIMKEAYTEVCEKAVGGDSVAQGLLAYWFKHGNQALPENIEYSMKWLMLSGSNENKHSVDKLAMLFNFIYDTIAYTEEFQFFADDFGLTEENYKYCLGPLICLFVVKQMNIDALELAQQPLVELQFNSATMNRFTNAANKSVDEIMETLRKANKINE